MEVLSSGLVVMVVFLGLSDSGVRAHPIKAPAGEVQDPLNSGRKQDPDALRQRPMLSKGDGVSDSTSSPVKYLKDNTELPLAIARWHTLPDSSAWLVNLLIQVRTGNERKLNTRGRQRIRHRNRTGRVRRSSGGGYDTGSSTWEEAAETYMKWLKENGSSTRSPYGWDRGGWGGGYGK